MEKEKYGIDAIKKGLGAIIQLGENIEKEYSDDGKVTLGEGIAIAIKSIPDVYNIARNIEDLRNEYNDLSNEEREEIKAWVKQEFDIEDDYIEQKVEAAWDIAIAVEKYFSIKKA